MWLWESELRELGFRRKASGYWCCARRFGLRGDEHVSMFVCCEHTVSAAGTLLVEFFEFHVTFPVGEDVHFYYHEGTEGEWVPAGFTSSAEVRRLGLDPVGLRVRADRVAEALVAALGGVSRPR